MLQVKDESKQRYSEYEEMKKQIEEDSDREILNMRNRFEQRVREEQDTNIKLKGETGIMRKKYTSLQKEIDDQKEDLKKNQTEITKLNNVIRNLEKDILGLKKEIQERDETIQDKVGYGYIIISIVPPSLPWAATEQGSPPPLNN